MTGKTTDPRIFISYSWSNPKHERWVVDLAERLCGDGVDTVLDKWDLKEGQDKYHFMEQMVRDPAIYRVLMICDQQYAEKANERRGGVGTESQIISKELYENITQEKFVPIVVELNSDGKPCLPTFVSSRIYLDFSQEALFEESYEKLLRNIYNRPQHKKPAKGVMPVFLQEEQDAPSYKCVSIQKQIRAALMNDRQSADGLFEDFVEAVVVQLNEERDRKDQEQIDERVLASINRFLPVRDAIVDVVLDFCKYRTKFPTEKVKGLLERLLQFNYRPETVTSWNEMDFDAYRFFNYEIALYIIAGLNKKGRFSEAAELIYSHYFFSDGNRVRDDDISAFNNYIRSLDDYRNNRLKSNRISIAADQIKERARHSAITFRDLLLTDCLMYFVMSLKGRTYEWYPRILIYLEFRGDFDFFIRLKSFSHFEKVKPLLGVKTTEQYKAAVEQALIRHSKEQHSGWNERNFPSIKDLANLETVGTVT